LTYRLIFIQAKERTGGEVAAGSFCNAPNVPTGLRRRRYELSACYSIEISVAT
jgi:hypothetical protein